ncbi:MAG: PAS domain-containing sensor histidine kinase [Pirellulaceae bacterium]
MSDGSQVTVLGDAQWQALITRSFPGLIWSTDTELRITHCHSNEASDAGREWVGKTLCDVLGTADPDSPPLAAHRQALRGDCIPFALAWGGQAYTGQVGPAIWQGKIVGCVAVAVATAIATPKRPVDVRWESIANTVVDLILFLDLEGRILEVNRTATKVRQDQVVNCWIFDFVPQDSQEPLRQAVDSVLRTGQVATLEVRYTRRFGQPSWQLMRIGPVRTEGKTTGLVLLASDITSQKQAIQRLRTEEELLRDLLELQDRERRMVACEIHDGFIQDVVGARMILQGFRQSLAALAADSLKPFDSAVSLLARAVNEGRRLISELRPMILDEMGIIDAIEFLISEEEAQGDIRIEFVHRVELERLPALLQATIFRIARESLNNARRHGAATRAEIRLTQIGTTSLILEIQDDGVGFDPDSIPANRYGLVGIRERAQLFGGGATIESAPGKGTRITVKLAIDVPQEGAGAHQSDWTWTT